MLQMMMANDMPMEIPVGMGELGIMDKTALLGSFLGFGAVMLIPLLLFIFLIIASCKMYSKAGRGWWEAIIPFYSAFIYFRIVKASLWWLLVFIAPIVLGFIEPISSMNSVMNILFIFNIILGIFLTYRLSKVFGHGVGFTIGLILLPFIFLPILAFGKSEYESRQEFTASTPVVEENMPIGME